MFKFVTLYRQVDDEEALEHFFAHTHRHLAEQLPGLLRLEVSRIHGKPGGQSRFHLMVELYFASRQARELAMASKPGIALIAALQPWYEARVIAWFYAETFAEGNV